MYPDPNSSSQKMYDRALASLPGGNTRTTVFMKPYPIYAARGEGCRVWDLDGNVYIDCINNFTSQIHGHAHPALIKAATRATGAGLGVRPADGIRGRSRRTAGVAAAVGRSGPLCQFRHRSRDDGAEGGAGAYRPAEDRQMRGRLSRLLRLCRGEPRSDAGSLGPQRAGVGRLCQGHARQRAGRCRHHSLQRYRSRRQPDPRAWPRARLRAGRSRCRTAPASRRPTRPIWRRCAR